MKIGIVWDFLSARSLGNGIALNPKCPTVLLDNSRCGLPATVRVTDPSHLRSTFWCPFHVWPRGSSDAAWDRYRSRFPDALDRTFINRMHGGIAQ